MVEVRFIDTNRNIGEEFYPRPAKNNIPDWYKKMPSYGADHSNMSQEDKDYLLTKSGLNGPPTVKKCMPVFDSMTSGYYIVTHSDFLVYSKENDPYPWYRWSDSEEVIDFHEVFQVEGYPMKKEERGRRVGRYSNPWTVVTPKGYSCLFVSPMHVDSPIKIIPAVVDTDTYHGPVQLPFFFTDPDWRDVVPAGTPIAQVIPFKRDSFTHTIEKDDPNNSIMDKTGKLIRSRFYHVYKNLLWSKKEYN
jgi:hypothetical protein